MSALIKNLFFIILVIPISHSIINNLNKLKMFNKDKFNNASSKIRKNLQNDNYIVIYYAEGIDYYDWDQIYNVSKEIRREIHFKEPIRSLNNFFGCDKSEGIRYLKSVDFSNFNSASVSDMGYMFSGCWFLTSVDFTNFDTSQVVNMEKMFLECESLKYIDVSNFNTSKVIDMGYMFDGCCSLKSLDVSHFDTSNVINMNSMFFECILLESIDVSNFNTSKVIDVGGMFESCRKLKSINVSNFDTSNVINMAGMFLGCGLLKSIDVSNFNTSKVTTMGKMFCECVRLESIDLSHFNTSKVTKMGMMFCECVRLESIDLSHFNTSNVYYMRMMFFECVRLESIDLSHFNTSNVYDMSRMFESCYSLKSIVISNFNTSKIVNMEYMFYNCSSLKSIDLSHIYTSKVTNMKYMFYNCSSLISIDLSNFNMINCYSYDNMFSNISSIRYINIHNLKNDKIISQTFNKVNHPIFVCQKDLIIDNPEVYNCCNFNLETFECVSTNSDIPTISDNSNINKSNDDIINDNTKSSSSISIGVIIGIVASGIVVILAITIIICYKCGYRFKKCIFPFGKSFSSIPQNPKVNEDFNKPKIDNSSNKIRKMPTIFEHNPRSDKDNPFKITFINQTFGNVDILIDSKETIDELIKFYFETCGKKDLYGDNSILFLINGKNISFPYPKDFVETLKSIHVNSESIEIIVIDNDGKMIR